MIHTDGDRNDARFHQMVDAVVCQAMEGFTQDAGCDIELMDHVARNAAWSMIKMIYDQDRELAALRVDRDFYRSQILDHRIRWSPQTLLLIEDGDAK